MTPAEKDAAVLAVLRHWSGISLRPSTIVAALANIGHRVTDDSVSRSLKRIGAVYRAGGLYSAPPVPQPAREPLPPFVCAGPCRRRVADYAGSRASGAGRKCRGCVERAP